MKYPDRMRRRRKFLVCVDDTPECRVALSYASRRARRSHGQVMLLRVIELEQGGEDWLAIAERMRAEAREEAEHLLQGLAGEISAKVEIMPELIVREGKWYEEIMKLIAEDPHVRLLVLGAGTGPEGPGPLVNALAGKMPTTMRIPVTVVPGTLTEEQIDDLV